MTSLINFIKEISVSGLADMLLMSLLVYGVLVWFQRKKAAFVLRGILICAMVYLIATQFNLLMISYVLRAFFAVFLLAIIIIFQEEIRYFFEKLAVWNFSQDTFKKKSASLPMEKNIETIVQTVTDLVNDRTGAIIVIKGRDVIDRHLSGGVDLDGLLTESILKSIFDPNSMGHDGAVIIEANKISQFAVHLPLSTDFIRMPNRGTRHAAALGLCERSDAFCIVVSEEKGSISIAHQGLLYEIPDATKLIPLLRKFYVAINPEHHEKYWPTFFRRNYKEKILALGLTMILWFVLVHESKIIYKNFIVPLEYLQLEDKLAVNSISPEEVELTFSGPRSSFHFINDKSIRAYLKMFNATEGEKLVMISESNLLFPKELTLENISPKRVKVDLRKLP